MRLIRRSTLVVLLALCGGLLPLASPALSQQLDAKRGQATALEERIRSQGEKLSLADEQYNQARLQHAKVTEDAASAKSRAHSAEIRYGELKSRLARRVRLLYMNPGAPFAAFLGARSLAQMERARVLGASVLTADTELVMKTEKTRREVLARADQLDRLRADAAAKEREIEGRRATVGQELENQRALLQQVKGDIAKLIEEQRRQEIVQAQQEAARETPEAEAPAAAEGETAPDEAKTDEAPAPPPPVSSGAAKAVATARDQIGKPYEWAADGPDTFDCSGLTMYAWGSAGVSMSHSAAAQYNEFPHVSRSELQSGDLVFFGKPIHHVGIYEGGGIMINAPQTGEFVRRDSIDRADYVGASRP